jgi:DNA-binding beta-propeller fold protein YncE
MIKYFINLFLFLTIFVNVSCSQKKESENLKYFGNIAAPDFPKDAEWLNTDKPVSLKDLRGKLVLLDFWTYACINCMHIIPDLKKLEGKYKNELQVIGVHSAKFLTERGTENIRQAILRYEIEHPVINDKDLEVWNNYTVHAWPTLVLIDPNGKIIFSKSGEGVYDVFDPIISDAVKEYDKQGNVLNRIPIDFTLEKNRTAPSLLSFPGKITADPSTSRIFITDSNNNRVLILKMNEQGNEAMIEEVIGSGKIGKKDGSYTDAEFFRPQGLAFNNDKLYVADTENHLIREIDLNAKRVSTIAGTGNQSKDFGLVNGKTDETALSSPWDLVLIGNSLYIAMAGVHQLWKLDLNTNEIGTYAGSGSENILDAALEDASLAQPSGITTDGNKLYFADSEVSGVRSAELSRGGKVETIIGKGLFDFGDIDGIGSKVRFQHPLGIVYNSVDRLLYVADTYNNKIKVVNPQTKEAKTYSGTGLEGYRDGKDDAQFNEPGGLTIMNGQLFVTDTNNHLLRVIDMKTKEVKTVRITNPSKLMSNIKSEKKRSFETSVKLSPEELKQGENKIIFNFKLPDGFKINSDAKPQVSVSSDNNLAEQFETEINTESSSFEVPIRLTNGNGKLNVELLIYYCEEKNIGLCKFKDLFFEIPVTVSTAGSERISIDYTLN